MKKHIDADSLVFLKVTSLQMQNIQLQAQLITAQLQLESMKCQKDLEEHKARLDKKIAELSSLYRVDFRKVKLEEDGSYESPDPPPVVAMDAVEDR